MQCNIHVVHKYKSRQFEKVEENWKLSASVYSVLSHSVSCSLIFCIFYCQIVMITNNTNKQTAAVAAAGGALCLLLLCWCGWTTVKRNCNLTTQERRRIKIKMTNHSNEWFNRNICYIFRLFAIVVCYFVFRSFFLALARLLALSSLPFCLFCTLCVFDSLLIENSKLSFGTKIGWCFSRPLDDFLSI